MTTNNNQMAPESGSPEGTTPCSFFPSAQFIAEQMRFFIPEKRQANSRSLSYEQIAETYIKTISAQIIKGIKLADDDHLTQGTIPVYMTKLRKDNPGRYSIAGKSQDWFDWLLLTYPPFDIVKQGYKHPGQEGTLTAVRLFEETTTGIVEAERPQQTFVRLYQDYADLLTADDPGEQDHTKLLTHWVPIDTDSLEAYIEDNQRIPGRKLNKRLQQNEVTALEILKVSKYLCEQGITNQPALPQVKTMSSFGRTYYKSLNLQNIPKVVRHAALGNCYQYDIVSSVFAWQLWQINDSYLTPATKELVVQRTEIRSRLVRECIIDTPVSDDIKLKFVKQAITALGFGADLQGRKYIDRKSGCEHNNAIPSIIMNKDDRLRFQTHPWVQEFAREQEIFQEYMRSQIPEDSFKDIVELYTPRGQLKISSLMAYLYQHYESDLLTKIRTMIGPKNYLLGIHDAFYTRSRLSGTDIREFVQSVNPWIRLEEEQHRAWLRPQNNTDDNWQQQQRDLIAKFNQGQIWGTGSRPYNPEQQRAYRFFAQLDDDLTIDHLRADPEVWKICEPYWTAWQLEQHSNKELPGLKLYQGILNQGREFNTEIPR